MDLSTGADRASAVAAVRIPDGVVPAAAPVAEPVGDALAAAITAQVASGRGEVGAQAVCAAYTRGDNVHRSSTGFAASGHGWWDNVNCSATYADVTVQLQQYYGDGVWRNQGSAGKARVLSGGGSGQRATGRADCIISSYTGWRGIVDVDLVALIDDSSVLVTPSANIYCRR